MTGPAGLRRFLPTAEPAPSPQEETAGEVCDMCATEIAADHGHVADLEHSALMCACRACYLLFTRPDAGRYRSVPDRYLTDPARPLAAVECDGLDIPVGLVFFLRRADGMTAFYPSPAGATECQLDLAAWNRLVEDHPLLREPEPDVEAVLISRDGEAVESFVVPIDACYELAGRVRQQWRGFDGGAEAHASLAAFLDGVRSRARALEG